MSSFYGNHGIGGGGGGVTDYNQLSNKPITNIEGSNATPVSLNTLEYGTYLLSGYYKYTIDGDVYEADPPIMVKIMKDEVTNRRVVYYETTKNGVLIAVLGNYNADGTVDIKEHSSTGDDPDIPWTDLDS